MICLVGISFSAKAQYYGGYYGGGGYYTNQVEQQLYQLQMMNQQMQMQNMQMQMQAQQAPWNQPTTPAQMQQIQQNLQEQFAREAQNAINSTPQPYYEHSSSHNSSSTRSRSTRTCGACDGKGWIPNNTRVPSFGSSQTKWCSDCNKTVPINHYHETCPSCKGKGEW